MIRAIVAAKTLLVDLETAPNLSYVWGKWEQNTIAVSEHWYILAFAYKWQDEKKVHSVSLPQFKDYKKDKKSDKELCKKLWALFNEADIVIGHNSDQFDIKKARARFLQHSFSPHSPFQSIDTKKVSKRNFRFDSNSLDDLGAYLGLGRKIKHEGFEAIWLGCMVKDDPKAWEKMMAYNRQDIVLLERVYNHMRPWMDNHPNMNLYNDTRESCPNCASHHLIRQGYKYTRAGKVQRWQCQDCGAWSSSPKAETAVIR
jgi:hypothetical protein